MRGATGSATYIWRSAEFQSTRPLRGATFAVRDVVDPVEISIHAPLAGRDSFTFWMRCVSLSFQSTRPLRGATFCLVAGKRRQNNFNPRAPCGARPSQHYPEIKEKRFQSTRPLRGATLDWLLLRCPLTFQSTRPLRGATGRWARPSRPGCISIHAPLAGRDAASYGVRRQTRIFQSTRPLRGATLMPPPGWCRARHFNPRAPCGARPLNWADIDFARNISIHAPLAGRDTD